MLKCQNSLYLTSGVDMISFPLLNANEIILLGRSNVGKSTFINKFCNKKKLARISSKPGKTQTLNFYYINDDLTFVDAPGYGYAKVSKKMREDFGNMIETYLMNRDNLRLAILLVDYKVGPTKDDLAMYEVLKYYGIDVLLIGTKKDKLKKSMHAKQSKKILAQFDHDVDYYFYSFENKQDMENIHELIKVKLS